MKIVLLLIILTGCSDGFVGKLQSFGAKRSIECYSGGKLIYKGTSSGKISSEANSDGYYFLVEPGKLLEVSGNCVIGK